VIYDCTNQSWEFGALNQFVAADCRGGNETIKADKRTITFDAVSFYQENFDIELVNLPRFYNEHKAPGPYTLENLKNKGLMPADVFIVVNAGWSASEASEPLGFLKIDGRLVSDYATLDALSALFCVDDTTSPAKEHYSHQTPVVFYYWVPGAKVCGCDGKTWDPQPINERLLQCENVVQVGPRVVETGFDKTCPLKTGISPRSLKRGPSRRTILVVAPKEGKRKTYVLVTSNPAQLYDLQQGLLAGRLDKNEAYWAVALSGGASSGMLVRDSGKILEFGELDSELSSVLFVRGRTQ
jgi:hypothetical protein